MKVSSKTVGKSIRLYGRERGAARFYAIDLSRGVQVGNLIYATTWDVNDDDDVDHVRAIINALSEDNPDWEFEYRGV